jgi:hypothetical protein
VRGEVGQPGQHIGHVVDPVRVLAALELAVGGYESRAGVLDKLVGSHALQQLVVLVVDGRLVDLGRIDLDLLIGVVGLAGSLQEHRLLPES